MQTQPTCRDGGSQHLGAAAGSAAAAAAGSDVAQDPGPRPPTPGTHAATVAGEPSAAASWGAVLGTLAGEGTQGYPNQGICAGARSLLSAGAVESWVILERRQKQES